MRFDCPRKELSDAVNMANLAVANRSALQIFLTLKIEAQKNSIRVVGSDQNMWIEKEVACMVDEPGSACISAKTLADIINAMPEGDIHLEANGSQLSKVTMGASEYQLQMMDSEDFIELPPLPTERTVKLPMKSLATAINSVVFAVSPDSHRVVLTGILFTCKGKTLQLVATDTHRLAVKTIELAEEHEEMSVIVPEKALKAIRGLPLNDDEIVELKFGNDQIGVEVGGTKIISQLLEGTFPNWERIMPGEATRQWSVESDQLAEKIKRTMIIARDSGNRIKMVGNGDVITITARSEDRGDAHEEVPMVAENGDVGLAFNGKYIQDFLAAIESPGVKVDITENTRPVVFKPADPEANYTYVVMPMQF